VITLIALRNLAHRPLRSLFLLFGYSLGVGVMIVLLAIGQAMLAQARDEKLVGGGQVTVLPEGMDIEVMKTGGVGGLFFSIANARFIYRELLASRRLSHDVATVAPQIDGKLLYLRAHGTEHTVRAAGEIPSHSALVDALPPLISGSWRDDDGDRRWASPTPHELYTSIDHFHMPPAHVAHPESWAEWHYFNVLSPGGKRWAFISYIVGGDVRGTKWGGQIAVSVREQGGRTRRFTANVPRVQVHFSTDSADLEIGTSSVHLLPDGRYALRASARENGSGAPLRLDLVVTPAPDILFPGGSIAECADTDESCPFASGYAVPGLRAGASGSLCVSGSCEHYSDAQSYHDHNWGVWHGVSWDWGATRAGAYTLLYGRVAPPDSAGTTQPFFVYLTDSLGFRALFRPHEIAYVDGRTIEINGRAVRVPSHAVMQDARGADTLRVELEIEDAIGSDTRTSLIERGDAADARRILKPYFIQMKGQARISGRVGGSPVSGTGTGFFETYR
jgi:hypothetical protein